MMASLTTVKVSQEVRSRINQFKRGPETQSEAIDRALDIAERRIAEAQRQGVEPSRVVFRKRIVYPRGTRGRLAVQNPRLDPKRALS